MGGRSVLEEKCGLEGKAGSQSHYWALPMDSSMSSMSSMSVLDGYSVSSVIDGIRDTVINRLEGILAIERIHRISLRATRRELSKYKRTPFPTSPTQNSH